MVKSVGLSLSHSSVILTELQPGRRAPTIMRYPGSALTFRLDRAPSVVNMVEDEFTGVTSSASSEPRAVQSFHLLCLSRYGWDSTAA